MAGLPCSPRARAAGRAPGVGPQPRVSAMIALAASTSSSPMIRGDKTQHALVRDVYHQALLDGATPTPTGARSARRLPALERLEATVPLRAALRCALPVSRSVAALARLKQVSVFAVGGRSRRNPRAEAGPV